MPISNTFTTDDAVGIREDLSDVIYNISPTDTPFFSNAKRGKVSNTLYEWQVDELADVDLTNAEAEGFDNTDFDEVEPTVRTPRRKVLITPTSTRSSPRFACRTMCRSAKRI